MDFFQPVQQGASVDDEHGGGLGNVPLTQQVGPEGLKVGGAVEFVVVPQKEQGGGEGIFQGELRPVALHNVPQGAAGKQSYPPVPPVTEAAFQGDLALEIGRVQVPDVGDRGGDTGVEQMVPAQRG